MKEFESAGKMDVVMVAKMVYKTVAYLVGQMV
jgi:hypothetical protein